MAFGILPAGIFASATEAEKPEVFKVDFIASAKKMAQEDRWEARPNALAVLSGTSVSGIKFISGNMNTDQNAAYQQMFSWLEDHLPCL